MSTTWWVAAYLVTAAFLAWIAFGRGLRTLLGGVLATLVVEGVEPVRGKASYKGKSAVILSVKKQPGANTL